jgi:hypothetical protein
MDSLPEDLLKEISYNLELRDLSTYLYVLLTARIYNYKDKYLQSEYIRKNQKYEEITHIASITFNFIDYYDNLPPIIDYLAHHLKFIIWGKMYKKETFWCVYGFIIEDGGESMKMMIDFMIKNPAWSLKRHIMIMQETRLLLGCSQNTNGFNNIIYLLTHKEIRPYGPYNHIKSVKTLLNDNPKLHSQYFFQLSPAEKERAKDITTFDPNNVKFSEHANFGLLSIQLSPPEDNKFYFYDLKESAQELGITVYKPAINYKIAYEGWKLCDKALEDFVPHINMAGIYQTKRGQLLKLSVLFNNFPLMVLCIRIYLSLLCKKCGRVKDLYFNEYKDICNLFIRNTVIEDEVFIYCKQFIINTNNKQFDKNYIG